MPGDATDGNAQSGEAQESTGFQSRQGRFSPPEKEVSGDGLTGIRLKCACISSLVSLSVNKTPRFA